MNSNWKLMIIAFAVILAVAFAVGSVSADSDAATYGSDVQPYAGLEATYAELNDGSTYYIVKGGSVSISFAGIEASGMETDLAGSGLITDYANEKIYGTLLKSATVTIGDKTIGLEASNGTPVYGKVQEKDVGWFPEDAYIQSAYSAYIDIITEKVVTGMAPVYPWINSVDSTQVAAYGLTVSYSVLSESDHKYRITVSGTPTAGADDLEITVNGKVNVSGQIGVVYTAHLKIIDTLQIHFNAQGGTVGGNEDVSVKYGASVELPGATKTGENFMGWYTQTGGLGILVGSEGTVVNTGSEFSLNYFTKGKVTLYAYWNVTTKVETISDIPSSITMSVGDTYKLKATTGPEKAQKRWVVFDVTSGSDLIEQTSTVNTDDGGYFWITALTKGTVEIEVRAADGGGASTTCTVTIVEQTVTYEYTLKYDLKGGYGDIPTFSTTYSKSSYSTTVTTLEPNKSGYIFKGWDTESSATKVDFTGGNSITLVPPGPTILYAVWVKIATEWTLSFDLKGGSGTFTKLTAPEAGDSHTWTLPTTSPTREGWTFSGWARNSTSTIAAYPPGSSYVAYEQNDTIYAIWTEETSKNTFEIEFDLCGGSGDFGNMVVESEETSHTFTIPSSKPTKDGYEFVGWGKNAGTSIVSYYPGQKYPFGSGTTTLYAVWKQYTYVLTLYETDESGLSRTLSGTGFGEVSVTIPADYEPSRNGYRFECWQTKDGSTTYQPGQTIKISANTSLYAKWIEDTEEPKPVVWFHVTCDDSQSWSVELSTDNLTFPSYKEGNEPTRDGYDFLGWADVDGASTPVYEEGDSLASEMATPKTLHVYAVWKIKSTTWTLELKVNGGAGASTDRLSMSATADMDRVTFTVPAMTLTRSGYTFVGWHEDRSVEPIAKNMMVPASGGQYIASLDKWSDRAAVLYAIWKDGESASEKYIVTFDVGEGTGGPADTTSPTAEFELPNATPKRDGYVFAGWEWKHDGKTETVVPGKTSTITLTDKETTLTAIWEKITSDTVYEIIFYDSDSQKPLFDAKSFKSSESSPKFTIPSDYKPTKVGYEFLGWSKVPNGTDRFQPGQEVDELDSKETVLYAVWKSTSSGSPNLAWKLSISGSTLTYDASDSENVITWLWDFGDGTQSSGPSGTHEYDKLGTYTITLTVYSASGLSDSCAKNVVVSEKSSPDAGRGIGVYVAVAILIVIVAAVVARSAGIF